MIVSVFSPFSEADQQFCRTWGWSVSPGAFGAAWRLSCTAFSASNSPCTAPKGQFTGLTKPSGHLRGAEVRSMSRIRPGKHTACPVLATWRMKPWIQNSTPPINWFSLNKEKSPHKLCNTCKNFQRQNWNKTPKQPTQRNPWRGVVFYPSLSFHALSIYLTALWP